MSDSQQEKLPPSLPPSSCSPDLISEIREILPQYLETLSAQEDYWDGLYTSDREQSETDIERFLDYLEANAQEQAAP